MLASGLSLALLAAFSSAVVAQLNASTEALKHARLHHEISAALDHVSRELRRAGAWASSAHASAVPWHNPFTQTNTALSVTADGSCVLYSYDRNRNGREDGERFGFRLRDGAIENRIAGRGCRDRGWQKLSDPAVVRVDTLRFEPISNTAVVDANGLTLTQHAVAVTVTASLSQAPQTRLALTAWITLGNATLTAGGQHAR